MAALCERDDTSDAMMKRIEQECMEALLIAPDSSLFYTLARFGWNGVRFEGAFDPIDLANDIRDLLRASEDAPTMPRIDSIVSMSLGVDDDDDMDASSAKASKGLRDASRATEAWTDHSSSRFVC